MTAAWCVTCLVNERVALDTAAVRQAFARAHVAYLKGDWTRQDPEITAYLRQNGRDGVPLYVYYPPHGQPEVLPQILTENMVLSRLGGLGAYEESLPDYTCTSVRCGLVGIAPRDRFITCRPAM